MIQYFKYYKYKLLLLLLIIIILYFIFQFALEMHAGTMVIVSQLKTPNATRNPLASVNLLTTISSMVLLVLLVSKNETFANTYIIDCSIIYDFKIVMYCCVIFSIYSFEYNSTLFYFNFLILLNGILIIYIYILFAQPYLINVIL